MEPAFYWDMKNQTFTSRLTILHGRRYLEIEKTRWTQSVLAGVSTQNMETKITANSHLPPYRGRGNFFAALSIVGYFHLNHEPRLTTKSESLNAENTRV